jgi:lantibiotic modifying enzyme
MRQAAADCSAAGRAGEGESDVMISAFDAGREALRWVSGAAVPADGGATWPETRAAGAESGDHLYGGTAGVLVALAEARLSGIADFDDHARAAAGRLRSLVAARPGGGTPSATSDAPAAADAAGGGDAADGGDNGFYTGLSGYAVALGAWASVSGDSQAAEAARGAVRSIAAVADRGQPVSAYQDLLSGEAGILLVLLGIGDAAVRPAAAVIADRLIAEAEWPDGEPDWYAPEETSYYLPNFSHGAAGIAYALATASGPLERPDFLEIGLSAGRRLVRLGSRPDGTLAVPHSIPQQAWAAPVSYGWCHGPTGTVRLFELLDRLRPGEGWAAHAGAARRAVRASGLPERRYPGFWDNVGQCCGTAGVGEMALDRYQDTGDPQWLAWASLLARDVLDRCIADEAGVRWSQTEYTASPPELEPAVGWMQGAAGIAGWLLRLARLERDGATARRIWWPDRPAITRLAAAS